MKKLFGHHYIKHPLKIFLILQTSFQNGADINAIDTYGYTPLVWAVKCNAFEIADVLLQMGSNVEKTRNWINSKEMMDVFKKHKVFKK